MYYKILHTRHKHLSVVTYLGKWSLISTEVRVAEFIVTPYHNNIITNCLRVCTCLLYYAYIVE